ncbi:hypothetical protein RTBOTA2_003164, partial [Rhodotorula toruloides]
MAIEQTEPDMSQQQQTQAQGLESFDENTRRELQQFLEQEQTKARIQTQIHEFTDTCWDLCIKGQPQSRFSRGEQACLANCTDRFLDASLFIVKSLEERKGQMKASSLEARARYSYPSSTPHEHGENVVLHQGVLKAVASGRLRSIRRSGARERLIRGVADEAMTRRSASVSLLSDASETDEIPFAPDMPAFAHARSTSSPSILAPIPLRPLSLVPESASSRKTPSTPDERLTLFEPPTRPVLAVIQPPSGSWSQNGGDGSILADGAVLRTLTPLPTLSPVSPPPSPPPPLPAPPSKPTTAPSLPSPLAPVPSSSTPSRRGRSPSIRRSSSSPSLPSPAPRPYPLSRRYTRSASLSHLSSRSPVQDRSIPQLSHSSFLDPPAHSDSSTRADASRTPSPTPQQQLFESLVCATLERRLADRIAKASGQSDGGKKLAEKAGLMGLRAGREMILWGAIRRVREAEQRRSARQTPQPHSYPLILVADCSISSFDPAADCFPLGVSDSNGTEGVDSTPQIPLHYLTLFLPAARPQTFELSVRGRRDATLLPRYAQEDLAAVVHQPSAKGYRRSILGVKLPRLPKKAARFEET